MTNGCNGSSKSRSCENNLDLCGRKMADQLTISTSSLIDLPTSLIIIHTNHDNLSDIAEEKLIINKGIPTLISIPVTSETVNKSVDLPSAQRLAKRLHASDGFKSTDVFRHLSKRNMSSLLI
ncbi:unnamed protein product [Rotaria magnacalcarata]